MSSHQSPGGQELADCREEAQLLGVIQLAEPSQ